VTWFRFKIVASQLLSSGPRCTAVWGRRPGSVPGRERPCGALIDPATGDLHVVWEDARLSGQDESVIPCSRSGGATWSRAKRVNTPGGPAFTPS